LQDGLDAVNLQHRIPLCPRCKNPLHSVFVKTIGGRDYVYATHKGARHVCYLGPAGRYCYAERLLKLDLTGLNFADYISIMLNAFMRALASSNSEAQRRKLEEAVIEMARQLGLDAVNLQHLEARA